MSILFDALQRDQGNETSAEHVGDDLIMDLSEPEVDDEAKHDTDNTIELAEPVAATPPPPLPPTEPTPAQDVGILAAQSIFSATKQPSRQIAWLIAGLVILILAGGGGYWYFTQMMTTLIPPSAITAPPASTPLDTDSLSQLPGESQPTETPEPTISTQTSAEANIAPTSSPPPPESAANQVTMAVAAIADTEVINVERQQTPPEKNHPTASLVPLIANTGNEERPSVKKAPPKKRTPPRPTQPDHPEPAHAVVDNSPATHVRLTASGDPLQEGYQALTEGRLDDAERLYLEVIAKRPRERDALLGLAVISHRQLHTERAAELYRQVLREDPGNAAATAALFSLSVQVDPVAAESHLKQLLDQNATSPELHNALGSVLARQKRWGEAQQEFFQAYSLEPANALYAYNLAVALDQLRKPAAALPYYEKSAQNLAPGDTAIDRDTIEQRVRELQSVLPAQR